MNDSFAKEMDFSSWVRRSFLAAALSLATLIGAGCCTFCPPVPCKEIQAEFAYYYRYNAATPDHSDIAFIEVVPPGPPRCVIVSPRKAPVYPDSAVTGFVKGGLMKIDVRENPQNVQVRGLADIAVYYKGNPATSSIARVPLAVENLTGVSRIIETAGIANLEDGAGGCGSCPSYPCNGYACCKKC